MDEQIKADILMTYLDQVLAGITDIEPVEDEEIAELLRMARTLLAADLNVDIQKRENLRNQMLAQLNQKKTTRLSVLPKNDELDEEALDYVAAAGEIGKQKNMCPYCGALKVFPGKCPSCHH